MALRLSNWIEVAEAIGQFHPETAAEVMDYLEQVVLKERERGEPDPLTGRSVRFEVRSNLLILTDIDPATRTVDVLSVEFLITPASLA